MARISLLAATLAGCGALLIWVAQMVATGATDAVDRAVLAWMADHRTKSLTEIAVNLTALGSRTILTLAATLAVVLLWTGGRRLGAADTALACWSAAVLTRTLKVAVGRPRPWLVDPLVQVAGFSFPSGHVSGVTAFLTAIALHTLVAARPRWERAAIGVFLVFLTLGVGWSRMYLGVHYPSDVVAGVCVGLACGLGAYGLLRTPAVVQVARTVLGRRSWE